MTPSGSFKSLFTESMSTDSSSDDSSNHTALYVIVAVLAAVVVALVVATAFACVFKHRLNKPREQQNGYETTTTQRCNPAYAGMHMDVM